MTGVWSRLWLFRFLIPAAGDVFILLTAMTASFAIREPSLLSPSVYLSFAPLLLLWLATFYAAGLYELRLIRDFVALVGGLLASGVVSWVLGSTYFYLLSPYLKLTPKTHLVFTVAVAHVAMLGWRRVILSLTRFNLMRLRLLVLADPVHFQFLREAATTQSGEGLDLADAVGPTVDLVVAESGWVEKHWKDAREIFSEAVARRISIVSLDNFYESIFGKVSPLYASDPAWALEHVLPRMDHLYFKVRRVVDIVAAAFGLLLMSPLLALAAALIWFFDGFSPFYDQERVGYLGRTFVLWKLRTMPPDADAAGPFRPQEKGVDARVTRLGRWLRRFRIDEFPQLWNVLRGDMSLVGPRPEWVKEVEILEKEVPNYHLRHLVPSGITGWAQVYYRATNDPLDSVEKHHYDLYYLKHFSLALDLSILLKTVKRVFIKDTRVASVKTPFSAGRARWTEADVSTIIRRR